MDKFHEFLTHLLGCGGMGVLLIGQILGTAGQSLEVTPHTPLLPIYLGPSSAVEFTVTFSMACPRGTHSGVHTGHTCPSQGWSITCSGFWSPGRRNCCDDTCFS